MQITKNESNIQDLLKLIALALMLIDHYGLYLNGAEIYRTIGRFVMPVFAFYTGYNFHGKMRHIIWILGAILIVANTYVVGFFMSTILISLAFGQLYLSYVGKAILHNDQMFFRHFVGMLILTPFTMGFADYSTLAIAWMMIGYKFHNQGRKDEGYVLLAALATMIFNEYGFSQLYYNLWQALGALGMVAISALCLRYANHENAISVDIRFITRNMLYIYFVSILATLGVVYSRMYM